MQSTCHVYQQHLEFFQQTFVIFMMVSQFIWRKVTCLRTEGIVRVSHQSVRSRKAARSETACLSTVKEAAPLFQPCAPVPLKWGPVRS